MTSLATAGPREHRRRIRGIGITPPRAAAAAAVAAAVVAELPQTVATPHQAEAGPMDTKGASSSLSATPPISRPLGSSSRSTARTGRELPDLAAAAAVAMAAKDKWARHPEDVGDLAPEAACLPEGSVFRDLEETTRSTSHR